MIQTLRAALLLYFLGILSPWGELRADPLPEGAVARLGSRRCLHLGLVTDLVFLQDGKSLLAASEGELGVRQWDIESGREVRRYEGLKDRCTQLALSPDGKTLAASDRQGILLWDTATAKRKHEWSDNDFRRGFIGWSPDGRSFVDFQGFNLFVHDTDSGRELRRIQKLEPHHYALSPDGNTLVVADYGRDTKVLDLRTMKERFSLEGCARGPSRPVVFSADGKFMAGLCVSYGNRWETTIRLWDATSGKKLQDFGEGTFTTCVFSPDCNTLAVGNGQKMELRDTRSGKVVREWHRGERYLTALAYNRDGTLLATGGDGSVRLWDVATGKERPATEGHRGSVHSLAFSPDGRVLVSGGDDGTLRLWDYRKGRETNRIDHRDLRLGVRVIAFAPDGKRFLSASHELDETVYRLWDGATGQALSRFEGERVETPLIAFSPDNRTVLITNKAGDLIAMDPLRGKEVSRVAWLKRATPGLKAFALSPDGRKVVWVSHPGSFGLCDLATGKVMHHFSDDIDKSPVLVGVAYSPDGTTVATLCQHRGVTFWNAATGKLLGEWGLPSNWRVQALAYSPDGRLIAVAGEGEVLVIETASRKQVKCFVGDLTHRDAIAFSPDGRMIAAGTREGNILLWDVLGHYKNGEPTSLAMTDREGMLAWLALASSDAARAHRAIGALVASKSSGPLERYLKPIPRIPPQRVADLIASLDDNAFAKREKAMTELRNLGTTVEHALRRTLLSKPSVEVRARIKRLLDELDENEHLWNRRGLAVLEYRGDTDAKRILRALAEGDEDAMLTREARASLRRLERK